MSQDKERQNIETNAKLLAGIDSPKDLRKLEVAQLPEVCREIRETLIENLSTNPGHFGSSMGAVDIIVALHYVFDTPHDRIVFDVGHQAYAHKLLTGRRDSFPKQRTFGGISGFPNPAESEYDTFTCGHASNSISAALGMATSDLQNSSDRDRKTIALIGDASISGGLAFEGLNNASINPNNLLIILNDNDMSIDANVGALHRYLSELTTSSRYNRIRFKLYNLFKRRGLIDDKRKGSVLRFGNALKSLISKRQNIFEGLNIRYFGPFDGNDVEKVVKVLNEIKDMKGPRILHLHTVKGRGYEPAEKNPSQWHAPGKFNQATGERLKSNDGKLNWQNVFGETLLDLARQDDRVVGITAAMPTGTSIDILQKAMPERVFDVGISEGHAVTFAGGMAATGKRPFVAIYSSFLQRGFDNIIHDVAIQHLPVTFCIDRAGIVGEDGVTHHGLFDFSYMRMIPGIRIAAPSDAATLRGLMKKSLEMDGPFAIRYPRGKSDASHSEGRDPIYEEVEVGKGRIASENGGEMAIVSVGPIIEEARKAVEVLKQKGIRVDLYDMIWVKPLDEALLKHITETHKGVITLEDGVRNGGFGSAVTEWISDNTAGIRTLRLGVGDNWVGHGSIAELRRFCRIDAEGIAESVESLYNTIKS